MRWRERWREKDRRGRGKGGGEEKQRETVRTKYDPSPEIKREQDDPHTYRQHVLEADDHTCVSNEPVPQAKHIADRLHQQGASEQHEVEAAQQVAQAEHIDACCPCDEDEAQHQPEEIAEYKHFHHVQVRPAKTDTHHYLIS